MVTAYKALSHAERQFRAFKDDLAVRPIFHFRERRVRGHLLLCLLAAYLRWQLETALAPLLFRDEAPPERPDPVLPAQRSDEARRKDATGHTPDGLPVQSLRRLLAHLATLTRNRVIPAGADQRAAFEVPASPTRSRPAPSSCSAPTRRGCSQNRAACSPGFRAQTCPIGAGSSA